MLKAASQCLLRRRIDYGTGHEEDTGGTHFAGVPRSELAGRFSGNNFRAGSVRSLIFPMINRREEPFGTLHFASGLESLLDQMQLMQCLWHLR